MSSKEDRDLQEAMDDLFRYTLIMGVKFNWQIIAATLVTIGLRLYKTVLDDQDFENISGVVKSLTRAFFLFQIYTITS